MFLILCYEILGLISICLISDTFGTILIMGVGSYLLTTQWQWKSRVFIQSLLTQPLGQSTLSLLLGVGLMTSHWASRDNILPGKGRGASLVFPA